jgi:hypothetical protein
MSTITTERTRHVPEHPELTVRPISTTEWCVCDGRADADDPKGLLCYAELVDDGCAVLWLRPAVQQQLLPSLERALDACSDLLRRERSRHRAA